MPISGSCINHGTIFFRFQPFRVAARSAGAPTFLAGLSSCCSSCPERHDHRQRRSGCQSTARQHGSNSKNADNQIKMKHKILLHKIRSIHANATDQAPGAGLRRITGPVFIHLRGRGVGGLLSFFRCSFQHCAATPGCSIASHRTAYCIVASTKGRSLQKSIVASVALAVCCSRNSRAAGISVN